MRILITGGSGFIGQNLINLLIKNKKLDIKIFVRKKISNLSRNKQIISSIINNTTSQKIKKFNPQVIIHLATYYSPKNDIFSQKKFIKSNIEFGSNLLESLNLENLEAFIYTNTYSVYNSKKSYEPKNFYSLTKYMFEYVLKYYSLKFNFKVVNLHLSDSYGPNDKRSKFFNLLVQAYNNKTELKASPGYQQVNLIHVKDVASALYSIIIKKNKLKKWENFSVFSNETLTLRELKKKFDKVYNVKKKIKFGYFNYRENEDMYFRPKYKKITNWRSRFRIIDSIYENKKN